MRNNRSGGQVSIDEFGYRAEWSTYRSRGFGVFRYPENALEKIGFECHGEEDNQYQFGEDPDETLDELMERSRKRRRSSLVKVHSRKNPGYYHRRRRRGGSNGFLLAALIGTVIGFFIGRNKGGEE